MKRVACIGTATIDIKARPYASIPLGSNADGRVHICTGGVGLAMSRNFAQLGFEAHLFTLVGPDIYGDQVILDAKDSGVNTDTIERLDSYSTATCVTLLDQNGITQYSVFDGEIIRWITPQYLQPHLELLLRTDLLVANTDLKQETLAFLSNLAFENSIYFYVNVSSTTSAKDIIPIANKTSLLGMNYKEAEELVGYEVTSPTQAIQAGKDLLSIGPREVIITLGSKGLVYCNPSREYSLKALPAQIVDTTGAGDALCSAFLYYRFTGSEIEESLEYALAAAAMTVETRYTVCPTLTPQTVTQLRQVFTEKLRNSD